MEETECKTKTRGRVVIMCKGNTMACPIRFRGVGNGRDPGDGSGGGFNGGDKGGV